MKCSIETDPETEGGSIAAGQRALFSPIHSSADAFASSTVRTYRSDGCPDGSCGCFRGVTTLFVDDIHRCSTATALPDAFRFHQGPMTRLLESRQTIDPR